MAETTSRRGSSADTENEGELLRRCQEGDAAAFRQILERYERRAYWLAYQSVGNHETARDIGQEAFLRVFKAIRRFDLQKKFYTWLYQIVVNLCIDHLRKQSHAKTVDLEAVGGTPAPGAEPDERTERGEYRRRVHATLDRLPTKYRMALLLRDIEGFSCEEISEVVGVTNATVRWRIHRARKMFRALWEGRTPEEEPALQHDASGPISTPPLPDRRGRDAEP